MDLAYTGLFASALVAATVIPGSSEIVLLAMLVDGFDPWKLWIVATLGNVIGSCGNWWLGRVALRFQDRRWFPVSAAQLGRAQAWFRRWGYPSLLLAWVPGVGDAFTVAAGTLRMNLVAFVVLVAIAKGGRYAALIGGADVLGVSDWFT
ncbi:MAG: YqaA family protein [Geminicoccaceae bacterium]